MRTLALNEHDVQRVTKGAQDLVDQLNDEDHENETTRAQDFLLIVMLEWEDEDGELHEAPAVWSERKSIWMKLGMLEAAKIDLVSMYDGER